MLVSGIQKNWFDYKYILFQILFPTDYYKILTIVPLCSHFKSPFRDYLLTLKKKIIICLLAYFYHEINVYLNVHRLDLESHNPQLFLGYEIMVNFLFPFFTNFF